MNAIRLIAALGAMLIAGVASAQPMPPNGSSPSGVPTSGRNGCACRPSCECQPSCACEDECGCADEEDCCCDECCDDCCDGCGCLGSILACNRCGDEEAWKLFDCCCLEENNVTIAGWVDAGYSYNTRKPINPAAGFGSLPHGLNYRHDEFQLNQAYIYAEKATEVDCCDEWDWGGRVDLIYGEDYIWTQAAGLETHPNFVNKWNAASGHNGIGGTARNGLALPQFYLTLAYDTWTVKVGHMYTMFGYDGLMATGNFFYSQTWVVRFGEPTTQTGVWVTKQIGDQLSAHVCVVNGWDKFDAVSDKAAVMVGADWKSCDENTKVHAIMVTGDEDGAFTVTGNRTGYHFWVSQTMEDWEYVFQHDAYWWDGAAPGGGQAEWYGIVNYLYYTINPCWKACARYEWFNDQHGVRIVQPFSAVNTTGAHWHQIGIGLNWTPDPNVIVRPEVRWDWVDPHTGGPAGVFDGGTEFSQTVLGVDAIFKF